MAFRNGLNGKAGLVGDWASLKVRGLGPSKICTASSAGNAWQAGLVGLGLAMFPTELLAVLGMS